MSEKKYIYIDIYGVLGWVCCTVLYSSTIVPPCSHSIYYSEVYNHLLLVSDVVYRPFTVITSYLCNRPIARDVTGRAVSRTGGQLELFSMEKMYRDRVCSSKAQTSDSRFSYSCSMLELPWHALRYRLAGWSPGTAME